MTDNKISKFVLTLLGPIWLVLIYWPWQLLIGLIGVSYYLVVERTQNVLFPGRLSSRATVKMRWYLVPLILIAFIPAMAVQLVVALYHLFVWWHRLLGSWQTGVERAVPAVLLGLATEVVFILVFIGSFYHPLPWHIINAFSPSADRPSSSVVPERWYHFEGEDPIRLLLTGPVLFGAFLLLLVPTIVSRVRPKVQKFLFLPAWALCLFALFQTLWAEEIYLNQRWTNIAIGLFIAMTLFGMMVLAWRTLHRSTSLRQFVWFSAIRLLEKKRIALFSLAAVTLCTAMLLIIMSVMGGFVEQVRNKSHGVMGDIILDGDPIRGFPYYDGFIKYVKKLPIVQDATSVLYTAGLMRVKDPFNENVSYTNPVKILGIDLAGKAAVTNFGNSLNRYKTNKSEIILDKPRAPPGKTDGEKNYGLIYGLDIQGLSRRTPDGDYHRYIEPYTSCTLSLIPISRTGTIVDPSAPSITQKFYMIDDSRTGVYDIDAQYVYVGFDVLQRLLYMDVQETTDGKTYPARTHQIQIKLKPGVNIYNQGIPAIRQAWLKYSVNFNDPLIDMVEVNTWEYYNRTFIAAVENERQLMVILFGIISIVAVFLILAIFYMIVVEKTRDIGILKSIGASAAQIAAIFLAYAGAIGFVGSIIGTVLGTLFVRHINEIQDWLIRIFGWRVWNREVYAFDQIPGDVKFNEAVTIVIAAIVASIIGAIIPAIRAAKMNPVEALRYE